LNNLRRDIHSAFEAIEPSLGGMPERVVQTVLADNKRRKKGMTFRARVPLPLVAAFVAVALVAAVLVGNQILQAWIAGHSPSPGGVHLTALQQLEARPLHLPAPKSFQDCNSGPFDSEGDFGSGPIHAGPSSATTTKWGEYFYNYAYTDSVIQGPMLVRVRDLFRGQTIVFVGTFAAGVATGTDMIDGKQIEQRTELVLNENDVTPGGTQPGWGTVHHRFVWDFIAGAPAGWSGSTGWQVDGPGFSEVFVAC
jgi:hypothetical protein